MIDLNYYPAPPDLPTFDVTNLTPDEVDSALFSQQLAYIWTDEDHIIIAIGE